MPNELIRNLLPDQEHLTKDDSVIDEPTLRATQETIAPVVEDASVTSMIFDDVVTTEDPSSSLERTNDRMTNDERTEDEAFLFLEEINQETSSRTNTLTFLKWNYQTNITDHNKKKYVSFFFFFRLLK